MDVVRKIFLSSILLSAFTACNAHDTTTGNGQFSSSDKAACTSTEIKSRFIVKWKSGKITNESAEDRDHFLNGFMTQNSDQIEFAEHDHMIHIDTRESSQATIAALSQLPITWGQNMVQAPAAWAEGANGSGIIVAVVDSGMDYTHPQLVNQVYLNAGEMGTDAGGKDKSSNGIDDDKNGYIDDFHGYNFADDDNPATPQAGNNPMDTNEHGTHVSGIIAAQHSAGPIQGMAERAKILPLRFINASGAGSVSGAIAAIQYAVAAHAKVINASWGGDACSVALQNTVAQLESQGVMFVAAAGNGDSSGRGLNLDITPSYPAAFGFPGQITVLATTELDAQAEFSNYSFTLTQMGAPGVGIVSTVPGGTKSLDGTSMATPFVTGAAALLFGLNPSATVAQVKNALVKSINLTQVADSAGGRLNVKKAVDLFKSM